MTTLRQQIILTQRGRFGAFVAPRADKPILLCLHGGPGFDSTSLHSLCDTVGMQFELVLMDQRGENLSRCAPEHYNRSLTDYALDAIAVAQQLSTAARPVGMLGHSFGGFVAQVALGRSRHPFQWGILSNTAADFSWVAECEHYQTAAGIPSRAADIEREIVDGRGTDELFRDMTVLYAPLYYPELPRTQGEQIIRQGTYTVATYRNACQDILVGMDLRADCRNITVPCLVLGAERDYVTPWSCQVAIAALITGSDAHCFSQVGHFPWVVKGQEYANSIAQWYHKKFPRCGEAG